MRIRRLAIEDAQAYWQTRNLGLEEFPDAFTTSVEEGLAIAPAMLARRFGGRGADGSNDFVLGAFADDGMLIGYAGFQREPRQKNRHKGNLVGMYVLPQFRGNGVGKKLLLALIGEVRELGVEQLNLSVTHSNTGARQLYLRAAFVSFGVEKNAIKVDGRYHDKEHMVLVLN